MRKYRANTDGTPELVESSNIHATPMLLNSLSSKPVCEVMASMSRFDRLGTHSRTLMQRGRGVHKQGCQ